VSRALTFTEFTTSARWPALDGLRALAVLMVITWHVPGTTFQVLHGNNGVTIFFVLSGFLITALGLRAERTQQFRYWPFLARRAFRILPLLYLGIAVYAVAVFVLKLDDRADAYANAIPWILVNLGEIPVLAVPAAAHGGEGPVPFAAVWSLGIEEKFYLVWPLIAFALLVRSRHRTAVAASLCLSVWVYSVLGDPHVVRLVTHYAPLLLGCTLACALYTRLGHRMLAAVSAPPMAALAALGAVAITLNEPTAAGLIGFQVAVAVIVAYVVLRPHRLAARALSVRPALFIAAISYPLYLFHSFGFKAAALVLTRDDGPASALHLLMCLAVAIPACWLLHRWVEKPMQDLGRRLTRRPRPAEARVPELVTT